MDTEKYIELQRTILEGKSPTDQGPYYHHSWWESYKATIKGQLGGVIIGALVGAIVGGAIAATLAALGTIAWGAGALAVVGAFAASGSLYGAHEFGDIGKVTGAVAASQEQAEARMKTFEDGKFSEIKQEIADLKTALKGGSPAAAEKLPKPAPEMPYRTTHYAKIDSPVSHKIVFWKVALIGLIVGLSAGALVGATPLAAHMLDGMLIGPLAGHVMTASMAVLGALGASFGINRDIFRKIFDKTDLWFEGMFSHERVGQQQIAAGKDIEAKGRAPRAEMVTAVLPEGADYPVSTYHRDRLMAAAEKALQNFDHTRATPQ